MKNSFRLMGVKELDAILKELPKTTAQNTAKRAMKRALEPVLHTAKALAPVGKRGGRTRDSIEISGKLTKRQAKENRGIQRSQHEVVMYVGPSTPQAHLVEFGTGPRHKKSTGQYVGIMPPNPFMRPAWDLNRNAVLDRLTDDLRAEIEKVIARRAKRAAKAGK